MRTNLDCLFFIRVYKGIIPKGNEKKYIFFIKNT